MMKRLEAAVYGHVQGVSFRYYTSVEAEKLRLVGWVANQADGSVYVVAEGPESALNQLLTFLQKGPPAAQVERVDFLWSEPTQEYSRFRVRY